MVDITIISTDEPNEEPGITPTATTAPVVTETMIPTSPVGIVTQLPKTGQGDLGDNGNEAIALTALFLSSVMIFGLAASRTRRR